MCGVGGLELVVGCVVEDGGRVEECCVDGGRRRGEKGKEAYFIDSAPPACGTRVESEAIERENQ